jgi:hypothetical protein
VTDHQLAVRQQNALATPMTLDDLTARAALIVKGGLAPKGLDTPEKVAVVMLKGAELGLKPMQSLSDIYVVNGQASLGTKLLAALFKRAGHDYTLIERTPERVTVRFFMRNGRTYDHTLTMAEAQQAKWPMQWNTQKNTWEEKATWKGMPMVMLTYRALSTGIRMLAPEVLHGMVTDDEAGDPALDAENTIIEGEARVVEPGPQPIAPPANNGGAGSAKKAAPHWARDMANLNALQQWIDQCAQVTGVSYTGVPEVIANALGVAKTYQYAGTLDDAKAAIRAWFNAQAPGADYGEPTDDDSPAEH